MKIGVLTLVQQIQCVTPIFIISKKEVTVRFIIDYHRLNQQLVLGEIEGVKTYIVYILIVRKDCFRNHVEQMRMIFRRLRAAGLKANARKCSLGLKEIPYLG